MRVHLLVPCLVDQIAPGIAAACVRLLERSGHQVVVPRAQTCCGQPAFNSGYWDEAKAVALHSVKVFRDAEVITGPSGSCLSMLKNHYKTLDIELPRDLKVIEITDFLELYGQELECAGMERTVAFHDSCHALREMGVERQPRNLLGRIPGLAVVELDDSQACCGFGGTFSVKMPHLSLDMAQEKVAAIQRTGADTVVSLDLGCLMNIQATAQGMGVSLNGRHVVELLAEALS